MHTCIIERADWWSAYQKWSAYWRREVPLHNVLLTCCQFRSILLMYSALRELRDDTRLLGTEGGRSSLFSLMNQDEMVTIHANKS